MISWGVRPCLGLVCMLAVRVAHADDAAQRPWAANVPDAAQTRAKAIFEHGNELLEQGLFTDALKQYDDAIAIWDHPAIHYNRAVAYINLDKPIDAYRELERALRYGPSALEPDVYQQVLVYQHLLNGQLVHLTVDCVDAGTHIALDGNDVAVRCPGTVTELLLPGRHKLVATKPGSVPYEHELAPSPGESPHERIDLMTTDEATVTRHRWPTWKPWVVVAAGAAVGLVGVGFELQSAATFRSYDRAIAVLCPDRPCESVPTVVSDAYSEGRHENQIAIAAFAVGGATIATGAVLLWLNRGIEERLGYGAPRVTARIEKRGSAVALGWTF